MSKSKNGSPISNKFKLIPKFMPFLTQFVNVSWNCQEKTLEFNIAETPKFDAYTWFGGINKRALESQKSSFIDIDQDSLILVLLDQSEKEVVKIKFIGLSLVDHNCYFFNEFDGHDKPLTHFVRISYSDNEVIPVEDDFDLKLSPAKKNELVDEEWQESCNYEDVAVS